MMFLKKASFDSVLSIIRWRQMTFGIQEYVFDGIQEEDGEYLMNKLTI